MQDEVNQFAHQFAGSNVRVSHTLGARVRTSQFVDYLHHFRARIAFHGRNDRASRLPFRHSDPLGNASFAFIRCIIGQHQVRKEAKQHRKGLLDRVSVGIQSLDEKVLETLGRHQSVETNLKALELLKTLPFRWNADIITAVPGESVGTTLDDITTIASYKPGHISFYCLTFEENTPLIKREKPMGEESEIEFLTEGWKLLKELGYNHYEVSNFAAEGEECIHNKVYWGLGQYIGIGPTAESALGRREMVVMRNTESLEEYLSSHAFDVSPLTKDETEESYLLTSLRTREGIDKKEYCDRFLKDFDSTYGERIKALDKDTYIDTDNCFSITEKGMLVLDSIILSLAMSI